MLANDFAGTLGFTVTGGAPKLRAGESGMSASSIVGPSGQRMHDGRDVSGRSSNGLQARIDRHRPGRHRPAKIPDAF